MEEGVMPRERIVSTSRRQFTDDSGQTGGWIHPFEVQVGWDKTGSYDEAVQVATVDATLDMHSAESGWWVGLDRDGCNRLIRALRKARDGAYGRDE
jgi:hypothetical protein